MAIGEREERDDRRGCLVSERKEGERERERELGRERASESTCGWATRLARPSEGRREGKRPVLPILFLFFKNVK
jgi:hypothetical protein